MQYEFKYILNNLESYSLERLNDTTYMDKSCYQIVIRLENMMTMPGFATRLEESEGSILKTLYLIDKRTYYPIRMRGENYSINSPEQKFEGFDMAEQQKQEGNNKSLDPFGLPSFKKGQEETK